MFCFVRLGRVNRCVRLLAAFPGAETRQIPEPAIIAHDVDAGRPQVDAGKLQPAAPEGRQRHARPQGLGTSERLGSKVGILRNGNIQGFKTEASDYAEMEIADLYGPIESGRKGRADVLLPKVDAYQKRKQPSQHQTDNDSAETPPPF
jgi:hypothetical protein